MHARAHLRAVAVDLEQAHAVTGLVRGRDCGSGVREDRHQAVAHALHDLAVAPADRGLLLRADLAQQVERGLVARLQRPVREVHEVGEQDRDVGVAAPAPLGLGQRLPELQGAEPELPHQRPLRVRLGHPAGQQVRRLVSGGGQGIPQLVVAGQQLAHQLRGAVHAGRAGVVGRHGMKAIPHFGRWTAFELTLPTLRASIMFPSFPICEEESMALTHSSTTADPHGAVFITGATGFVGMEILARYLEHTDRSVYAAVRAQDQAAAEERLREAVRCMVGDPDAYSGRLHAVPADIERPGLGLPQAERERWPSRSRTSSIRPRRCPSRCRSSAPARSTSRAPGACSSSPSCASARGSLRRYAHISTAYVAGTHRGEFSEEQLDVGQGFRNPYEQSKFEAELLVHSLRRRLPIQIFRPSIVVGERATGWTASFNVLYTPLKAFVRGNLPALPARRSAPVDVVPVDYVADAVFKLSSDPLAGTGHVPPCRRAEGHQRRPPDRAVRAARRPARAGGDPARASSSAWCIRCSRAPARGGGAACGAHACSSPTSRWTFPTGTPTHAATSSRTASRCRRSSPISAAWSSTRNGPSGAAHRSRVRRPPRIALIRFMERPDSKTAAAAGPAVH